MILDKELYHVKSPFTIFLRAVIFSFIDLFRILKSPKKFIDSNEGVHGLPRKIEGADCKDCSLCLKVCPEFALSKNGTLILDVSKCISCQECVEFCPEDLLYASSTISVAVHGEVKDMKIEL